MDFDQSNVERLKLERLLGEFDGAMRARARQKSRHLGERFNLFSVLARHGNNDERYVHTPFIGTLLDPAGEHGLGDLFLRTFLRRALSALDNVSSDAPEGAHVEIESHGVDIRIVSEDVEIIIENKLYARDQEKQLVRYVQEARQSTPQVVVIYLTLHGTASSQTSLGQKPQSDTAADPRAGVPRIFYITSGGGDTAVPVVLLSYEDDVRAALVASLSQCRSNKRYNPDVVGALEQYANIVDRVLQEKGMTQPSEEAEILIDKPENLAIGLRMQAAAGEAYGLCVAQFLLGIDKCFQGYADVSNETDKERPRLGAIARAGDLPGVGNKIIEPAQVENCAVVSNWVMGVQGSGNKDCIHQALLWYGAQDGHWAFSVELAKAWIFLGFVRLSGGKGERLQISEPSETPNLQSRIPRWTSATNHYGIRHAGAWRNQSVVRALAEVPQSSGNADKSSVDPRDPYGIEKLFAPMDVFNNWMRPYIGRSWEDIMIEVVGSPRA